MSQAPCALLRKEGSHAIDGSRCSESHTTRKPLNGDGYDDFVWFLLTSGSKQDVSSILTTYIMIQNATFFNEGLQGAVIGK